MLHQGMYENLKTKQNEDCEIADSKYNSAKKNAEEFTIALGDSWFEESQTILWNCKGLNENGLHHMGILKDSRIILKKWLMSHGILKDS